MISQINVKQIGIRAGVVGWIMLFSYNAWATIPSKYAKQKDAWFKTDEGKKIADHVLTWQAPNGSWPKNGDTASKPYRGETTKLKGTFDNGATTGELRFLARAAAQTNESRYSEAFNRGLDLILESQYPSGGWPQSVPLGKGYARHTTFNDNTMVRILELLDDVSNDRVYEFVDAAKRTAAEKAFAAGIACILKCQVAVNGKKTVWCAQHDEIDFKPRAARSFELVSLSGSESAGILKLLMRIEKPTPAIREAIELGVAWFESAQLHGIRIEDTKNDTIVVKDPNAPPVWARFYEIETNRPFFCGRDGVKKFALADIEVERRNGYAWYGNWGEEVIKAFELWKAAGQATK